MINPTRVTAPSGGTDLKHPPVPPLQAVARVFLSFSPSPHRYNFELSIINYPFKMIVTKIIDTADDFLNEREKSGNSGFINPEFEAKMREIGWEKGEPWCASFAKLVFSLAYEHDIELIKQIDTLFSKSAVLTYRNFDASDWKTRNPNGTPIMVPAVGALVVWRMGTGMSGHIGVVSKVISDTEFEAIEGNANSAGGREGVEVAVKYRRVTTIQRQYSLNLLGFVLPKETTAAPVAEVSEVIETPISEPVAEVSEVIETPIEPTKKKNKA